MKNTIFLFIIIICFSCSNNYDSQNETTISKAFSTEKFVGNTVAYKNNDTVKLGVSEAKLIESFNNYNDEFELNSKAISLELIEIETKHYIRFYNDDKSVSTVALLKSDSNKLVFGGTICKTTSCSSCCGCVPNGDYCTKCEYNTSDCSRTTSG